jgi:predicted metal-dependent enzyme (double-stranded beta helix superfamily)
MITKIQEGRLPSTPRIGEGRNGAAGLEKVVAAVRAAVGKRADWRETARLVASELERDLPSPSILTPQQRAGDPERYRSHVLHAEPDGSFSIVGLVWRPGQVTPIHDHVTCACSGSSRASNTRSYLRWTSNVGASSRRETP